MGKADYLLVGSYNAICDQCGKKFKNKDMRTQWDGLRVCKGCFEVRQPQDFVRGVKDNQSVPIARPDSTPTFNESAQNLPPPDSGGGGGNPTEPTVLFQDSLFEAVQINLTAHTGETNATWSVGPLINVNTTGAATTSTSSRLGISTYQLASQNFRLSFSFIGSTITSGAWSTSVYVDTGSETFGAFAQWVGGNSSIGIVQLTGNIFLASYSGTPSIWANSEHTVELTYENGVTSVYLDTVLIGTSSVATLPNNGTVTISLLNNVSTFNPVYLTNIEIATL